MRAFRLAIALVVTAAPACFAQKGRTPEFEAASPIGRWTDFAPGQKRRVHVWYEGEIWHFRCTCGVNPTVFDGTVTLDKGSVQIVGGEGEYEQRGKAGKVTNPKNADYVQLLPNGMAFRFQCIGKLNGLDFTVPKDAKSIRFQFMVNNETKSEYIFIGALGTNPSNAAFTFPAHYK